jgi:aspartyl-tRNA(Asn)/glutamyl-tRNA(Gln) amidotransferase subunit B
MPPPPAIASVALKVGLEIHVELATRTKMFSRSANLAHPAHFDAPPNSLIDPVVLGLPGALPVMNRAAVEMAMMVGLALGCSIAPAPRWDRKSYFYPDLPKGYQISQYLLPLCFDGALELPALDERGDEADTLPPTRIGIIRAHLEEDAGKLLHEAPGGGPIDCTIADYNRAGTPLLEIVTQPDFASADQAVLFCRTLRDICRALGVTEGILQRGHMRFEPNINCLLTLGDGRLVRTPIVEIKNLNSFRALKAAIEFELADQPRRWQADGLEMTPGSKTTRGWDDAAGRTFVQREKEEAHDYRYFPDPDLRPLAVDRAWVETVRARLPELPRARRQRYVDEFGLAPREAAAIAAERADADLFDAAIDGAVALGVERAVAARLAANLLLQSGAKRVNERPAGTGSEAGTPQAGAEPRAAPTVSGLGISPDQVAQVIALRAADRISAGAADALFGLFCRPEHRADSAEALARARGMLIVRDAAALDLWCGQAIAEHPQAAADVRAGKVQAVGRLVGAAMRASGGAADAAAVRRRLLELLGR